MTYTVKIIEAVVDNVPKTKFLKVLVETTVETEGAVMELTESQATNLNENILFLDMSITESGGIKPQPLVDVGSFHVFTIDKYKQVKVTCGDNSDTMDIHVSG